MTMKLPDGLPLITHHKILSEPTPVDGRFVLWVPGERTGGLQAWDRVAIAPGATVAAEPGLRSIAAVATPARQRVGFRLGGVLGGPTRSHEHPVWTLPGGGTAQRCGARRTDLLLVWSGDDSVPLDEARIRARWPQSREIRSIGPRLYLASGVEPALVEEKRPAPQNELPHEIPGRQLADEALAAARQAGDPRRIATALIDLAVSYLNKVDPNPAVPLLEEALGEARRLGDRTLEIDALSNLGQAALLQRRPRVAIKILEPLLGLLQPIGDPFAEKVIHERLGHARQRLGDHRGALAHFDAALRLAGERGDLQHSAMLRWYASITLAELGQPDRAIAQGQKAVDLLRRLQKPESERYAHHLADYRAGLQAHSPIGAAVMHDGSITTSMTLADPGAPAATTRGPSILRMALDAARSAVKFAGSGFRTVAPPVYQARLAVCSTCEQFTGLRCRVCGCIVPGKARLPHEHCPTGKWPH